jgi:hypothetical protein
LFAKGLAVGAFGSAGVAVVLEVGAVVFEDGGGIIGEFRLIVAEFFDECAAELVGRLFKLFDFVHGSGQWVVGGGKWQGCKAVFN